MQAIRRGAGAWLRYLGVLVAVTFFIAIAENVPPLVAFHERMQEQPQPWLALTVGATVCGFGLLVFVWATILFRRGAPRPRRRPPGRPGSAPPARSRRAPSGTATFAEVKAAFRTGDWLFDPAMRPFCIGLIGALLATVGVFGLAIVVGPPAAQAASAAALGYAAVRLTWAFARA